MSPRAGLDETAIIQAAAQLADQLGLDEVTLVTLAQKLEVRSPSLYNHVKGLQGLRSKLAVYGVEMLTKQLTAAVVGRSGDDAIRELGKAYLSFAKSRPGLYDATLRAPDPDKGELARAASGLLDLIIRVLQGYGLDQETTFHVVRCLRSMLHGLASLEREGGFGMPLDLNVTRTMLTDMLLAGIRELQVKRE